MAEEKSSKVEFTPPSDFRAPDNVEPGKDWDMVCSFRTKEGGQICLTKLGDTDMPGYGSKEGSEESEHKPDYSEYSRGIMEKMGEGGAPGPNDY